MSIGWVSESQRLYFSLETGDVHITSDESYGLVGTYLVDDNGQNETKLSSLLPETGSSPSQMARMLGVLLDGEFIFETYQPGRYSPKGGTRGHYTLSKVKQDFSNKIGISFSQAATVYQGVQVCYQLSPSGSYLAAAQLPIRFSAVSCDVWLKDLDSGTEKEILSIVPDVPWMNSG